jgi:hypothetical protein
VPTFSPTKLPTPSPTRSPTPVPTTKAPTVKPTTSLPTLFPTNLPTPSPTRNPTTIPTIARPTTKAPTSKSPTPAPTTKVPTKVPTNVQTKGPTKRPTECPTGYIYGRSGELIATPDYCDISSGNYECCDTSINICVPSGSICFANKQICIPYYTTYDPIYNPNLAVSQAICAQLVCLETSAVLQEACFNDETGRQMLLQGVVIDSRKSTDIYKQCNDLCKNAQCKLQFNYVEAAPSQDSPSPTPIASAPASKSLSNQSNDPNYCAISTGGFSCCNITADSVCVEKSQACSPSEGCVDVYETALPSGGWFLSVIMACTSGVGSKNWRWDNEPDYKDLREGFIVDSTNTMLDLYDKCKEICVVSKGVEPKCSFAMGML